MRLIIIYFLIAFGLAFVLAPLVLLFLRRIKAGQPILHYVDFHAAKSGTPTMGGFIFILPFAILTPFILNSGTKMSLIVVLCSLGFALIGFLDDIIKIKGKQNLGLRPYQKIIGQGGIALLVSIFYYLLNPEGRILIPFVNQFVDVGFFILPLAFFILIATTNSVNLTDGVDGLAASVSLFFLVFLSAIMMIISNTVNVPEVQTFVQLGAVLCGGLLCYLLFNTNKASVFMGDTGSLFLGALIATLSLFSFLGFFLLILGVMFVLSSVSVILQVIYFKFTKGKRIFLMTPFHHHLEKKGYKEAKIVFIYVAVTVIAGLVCLATLL